MTQELEFPLKLTDNMIVKAIAEVVADKQKRIDRLEQLIFTVYQNICMGVKASTIDDDDMETDFCAAIIERYNKLKYNAQQD